MQIEFYNREREKITFTQLSNNQYQMKGGLYYRFGAETTEDLKAHRFSFVDPSGGPYISEGMTLGRIHPNWLGKIVRYITNTEENNTFLIVTYPERIVKATVNRKEVFRIYAESGNIVESLDNFNDAVKWIEDKYAKNLQDVFGN